MTQETPAGWYPQTDGTQRYWDGSAWTEHIAPGAGAAPVSGQTASGAIASTDARPWWKKKRFIIPGAGAVVVVGIIALGAIAFAVGGGATATPTPAALAAPSTSPQPSESAAAKAFTMPDLVGANLQDAQDELQSLGSLLMDQQDASGEGRMQVNDSNWTVCTQAPLPGVDAPVTTVVVLSVVKTDEVCPGDAAAAPAVPAEPAAPAAPELSVSQQQAVKTAEDYLDFTSFSRTGLIAQLEFEQFSTADATAAVDSLTVDWNEQATKKAQEYLDFTSFSHSGLVDQLTFEGFTPEQAEFGVTGVGL